MDEELLYTPVKQESVLSFYLSGAVAGFVSILVSHPADTVKVRLQCAEASVRASTVCRSIYQKSGFRGFFSGVSAPLFFRSPITAWFFTSHELIKPRLEVFGWQRDITNFLCGAWAGSTLLPILVPIELFKCKSQSDKTGRYNMAKDFKHIMRTEGPKGLYKGTASTFLRESPGSGLLFMLKDKFDRVFKVDQEQNHSKLIAKKIMTGGMAGILAWCGSIPLDTIKSIIQTSPVKRRIPEVTIELYRAGGLYSMYRGLIPQCFRIFPGMSSLLLTYEVFKNFMN
ncbi:unnamed protein product [Moneuplotes crassus]|uniref:Mitochondrial carrier protein n=1 Tax=Euplotes crassus TaxID=5936 RepID=A0AAD1UGY6_EUPCR|nr:unnamed protein product [Moneuplotes crassus]